MVLVHADRAGGVGLLRIPSVPGTDFSPVCFFFLLILSYLSRSLVDSWGTSVDFTTSVLHSLRFSAFRSMIFHSRPVHFLMLSSHRFLCLPLCLPL